MESREIRGEGVDHEQDWIQERLVDASHTDEYAEAAETLKDQARDLQSLTAQGAPSGGEPNLDVLSADAQLPVDRMQLRQGGEAGASDSPIDLNQQPPEAEARARSTARTGGGETGSR